MAQLLRDDEIDTRLGDSQWRREGDSIVRELTFADFEQAIGFVNRVAAAAQEHNHHPDILLYSWNKVRLTLSTHSAGGLTGLDLALALAIDGIG